jgi:hypothetical protein
VMAVEVRREPVHVQAVSAHKGSSLPTDWVKTQERGKE